MEPQNRYTFTHTFARFDFIAPLGLPLFCLFIGGSSLALIYSFLQGGMSVVSTAPLLPVFGIDVHFP